MIQLTGAGRKGSCKRNLTVGKLSFGSGNETGCGKKEILSICRVDVEDMNVYDRGQVSGNLGGIFIPGEFSYEWRRYEIGIT